MGSIYTPCLKCSAPLALAPDRSPDTDAQCATCGVRQMQWISPAAPQSAGPPSVPTATGASCYFHDTVAAAELCGACGRYLCALCTFRETGENAEPGGATLCPPCFWNRQASQAPGGGGDPFHYPRYDLLALLLAAAPLVFFPLLIFSAFTAPAALFVALSGGIRVQTPLGRPMVPLVLAVLLAGAQIVGWVVVTMAIAAVMLT